MTLRKYLKARDGLPDPRGSLSSSLPSEAIALANREVENAMRSKEDKKRGQYARYDHKTRADIGKYATRYGVTAASRVFSRKLGKKINQSTVYSIKTSYLEAVKEKRKADSDDEVTSLPLKKRGRPLLLGENLDKKVQMYLKKIREGGGVVTASIVMAATRGILLSTDRSKLAEFGGHIELNRHWAYRLLDRMHFVRRKVTTAKSKHAPKDFAQLKKSFLEDVVSVVQMEEIPPELIMNWDQTGIKLVPSSAWTMDRQGVKRVEIVGATDKRLITAVFCGALLGDFLPLQVIYQGITDRCHPHFQFPLDWDITHSKKHWSTEETTVRYIKNIIVPYVEKWREHFREETAALVIMDNFKGQITPRINTLLEEHNIHVCLLPANTTDLLQPMDVAVNKPAKDFLKKKFEHWYSQEISKQLKDNDIESVELQPIDLRLSVVKELSAGWLVEMFEHISENPQFIVNGFIHAGISSALDGNGEAEIDAHSSDKQTDLDEETDSDEQTDSDEETDLDEEND